MSPIMHVSQGPQEEDDQNLRSPCVRMVRRSSKSPATAARVKIKNRRKRYLDTHPEYFMSPSLELADPLAYDRLIRRFQTSQEREAEGRKKGYSGVLEADLMRSEAKIEALSNPSKTSTMTYRRGEGGEILAEEKDEVPRDKDEGAQRWRMQMELNFLRGDDQDFDYSSIDQNEDYDDQALERREAEETYFEEQEPEWITDIEREALTGETGIQDY